MAHKSTTPAYNSHPLYGTVPVIVENGIPKCDPDFQPPLPTGAVRGNVHKQDFCSNCHYPKYFYTDEQKQCKECGIDFLFSASEQKFWYEDRQFSFYSKPIRCLDCRRKYRNERYLRDQMTLAANATHENPDDPHALIVYAETTYQYHDYFAQGNLERAIAAARKARKLDTTLLEALFWEATCLDAAGHFRKARQMYQRFFAIAKPTRRYKPYLSSTKQRLLELEEFTDDPVKRT